MTEKLRLRQLNVKVGLVAFNTIPLDFKVNYQRIMDSTQQCIDMGCSIRIGSQLEVCGYGCGDHFAEYDTVNHCWDVVKDILKSGITEKIVCELGCPVMHQGALYNARVILYENKVVAIRVKTIAADGDNYNQTRCFSTWKFKREVGQYQLPQHIQQFTGMGVVPIGVFILNFKDTAIAYEICEEAWISNNPMIDAALDGAQIFINGSASEIARGKLKRKLQMIKELTERHGGAYIYVNTKGLLQRQYCEGGIMVSQNGKIIHLSQIHQLEDTIVLPVIINLNRIRNFRLSNKSFQKQSHGVSKIPRVFINKSIATNDQNYYIDSPQHQNYLQKMTAIYQIPHATYEPSLYLWDVLRYGKASGFHISLSGGKNSATVALIVYNLCCQIYRHVSTKSTTDHILKDLRKILNEPQYMPKSAKQVCSKLLYTTYMQTENSTKQSKQRAADIANQLNANHSVVNFQDVFVSYKQIGNSYLGEELKYLTEGGTTSQNIALRGCQARSRMALSYFIAQLALEKHNRQGYLLKLASINLDSLLRGTCIKYDSSAGDLNPIGSFSSKRIKQFLLWNSKLHKFKFIKQVINEVPSSQLSPVNNEKSISQAQRCQLSSQELVLFAQLRRCNKLGPVSMFDHIVSTHQYRTVEDLAAKVKHFFVQYSANRHKMASMTPIFHYNGQGCEDSRLDQRPITYATDWSYQFQIIDERIRFLNQTEQRK